MNIGIITGSGFYDFPELSIKLNEEVKTEFGTVILQETVVDNHDLFFIARHGSGHGLLPNMINYRANIKALKQCGVGLIISTSVMGIIDESIPLGELLFFDDLFYLDNRLPDGDVCTLYKEEKDKKRGHYLFDQPFSIKAKDIAISIAQKNDLSYKSGLVHAHANGPRFNSKTEISLFKSAGCSTVSQTVGPEIILAGECEIGFLLLGYGVDYANGITQVPTPVEVLNENLLNSKQVFSTMILNFIHSIQEDAIFFDNGFVYRFE